MTALQHEIVEGDCLDVLGFMPDASVDAIVSDPPYGLSFMGKGWDHGVPGADYWREALRVAKPGAHLVAFGGTRTYHRLACAIEDAGWEVRDCLSWLYGSGFPKSLDVSKAIDKKRDDREDVLRVTAFIRAGRDAAGSSNSAIDAAFGTNGMAGHWTSAASQPAVPTWAQWLALKALLALGDEMDAEVWRLNGRKGTPGEAWSEREVVGEQTKARSEAGRSALPTMGAAVKYETWDVTAPATDAARQWAGWGTALKPAWEPIILARKPLVGTVAANVQAHGTGALNVDGCRIATTDNLNGGAYAEQGSARHDGAENWRYKREGGAGEFAQPAGRWPANVALDDEAAALLDAQSGTSKSTGGRVANISKRSTIYGGGQGLGQDIDPAEVRGDPGYGDTGGASRFFYCAKASRKERGEGNSHPTVKPIALMRWLCRLVTPPGGLILDPFTGSGSTGVAAVQEGFRFLGIDREAEYVEIARRRLAAAE